MSGVQENNEQTCRTTCLWVTRGREFERIQRNESHCSHNKVDADQTFCHSSDSATPAFAALAWVTIFSAIWFGTTS